MQLPPHPGCQFEEELEVQLQGMIHPDCRRILEQGDQRGVGNSLGHEPEFDRIARLSRRLPESVDGRYWPVAPGSNTALRLPCPGLDRWIGPSARNEGRPGISFGITPSARVSNRQ